ncbi:hypothetical protein [Halospeciosus flavus]|uniref:hypothetical protein n=1 Tax=Halospeciosus flavus TaxID=3032283 RepID=UPI0036164AE5
MAEDDELAALREQTSHGDRIDEAAAEDAKRDLVEDILDELRPSTPVTNRKRSACGMGISRRSFARSRRIPTDWGSRARASAPLDLEEGDVDRSEILRLALRLGFQEAAPNEFESVREAAREQATKGL